MEKPIGAPARGRRAWQPQHVAGPHGRGRSLLESRRTRAGPESAKNAGRVTRPRVTTLRVPPHTAGSRSCTRLVHLKGGRNRRSPRPRGGRAGTPALATHPHTLQYAHDHLHARAPRHASCLQLPGQKEGNGWTERGGNEIEAR